MVMYCTKSDDDDCGHLCCPLKQGRFSSEEIRYSGRDFGFNNSRCLKIKYTNLIIRCSRNIRMEKERKMRLWMGGRDGDEERRKEMKIRCDYVRSSSVDGEYCGGYDCRKSSSVDGWDYEDDDDEDDSGSSVDGEFTHCLSHDGSEKDAKNEDVNISNRNNCCNNHPVVSYDINKLNDEIDFVNDDKLISIKDCIIKDRNNNLLNHNNCHNHVNDDDKLVINDLIKDTQSTTSNTIMITHDNICDDKKCTLMDVHGNDDDDYYDDVDGSKIDGDADDDITNIMVGKRSSLQSSPMTSSMTSHDDERRPLVESEILDICKSIDVFKPSFVKEKATICIEVVHSRIDDISFDVSSQDSAFKSSLSVSSGSSSMSLSVSSSTSSLGEKMKSLSRFVVLSDDEDSDVEEDDEDDRDNSDDDDDDTDCDIEEEDDDDITNGENNSEEDDDDDDDDSDDNSDDDEDVNDDDIEFQQSNDDDDNDDESTTSEAQADDNNTNETNVKQEKLLQNGSERKILVIEPLVLGICGSIDDFKPLLVRKQITVVQPKVDCIIYSVSDCNDNILMTSLSTSSSLSSSNEKVKASSKFLVLSDDEEDSDDGGNDDDNDDSSDDDTVGEGDAGDDGSDNEDTHAGAVCSKQTQDDDDDGDDFIIFEDKDDNNDDDDDDIIFKDDDGNDELEPVSKHCQNADDDDASATSADFDSSFSDSFSKIKEGVKVKKRVRFSSKIEYHQIGRLKCADDNSNDNDNDEDDDEPECRKGPWEMYARDRMRFQRRIEEAEGVLAWLFYPNHRRKMMEIVQDSYEMMNHNDIVSLL